MLYFMHVPICWLVSHVYVYSSDLALHAGAGTVRAAICSMGGGSYCHSTQPPTPITELI